LCGAAIATGFILWIGIGTQIAMASGIITYEEKLTSVAGCVCTNVSAAFNTTNSTLTVKETHETK
jgi:hypothetical protein